MTRSEHIEWCKARALEYINIGDLQSAYTSMVSDLGKHPETEAHPAIMLGMGLMMSGQLSTPEAMKHFINGFG